MTCIKYHTSHSVTATASILRRVIRVTYVPVWHVWQMRVASIHFLFELCRRTQQPSLTVHPVDGSMFGLWPLFHLREGGKWTEMTDTQHGEALRHWFLFYTTLVSPSTGCKSQLFLPLAWVGITSILLIIQPHFRLFGAAAPNLGWIVPKSTFTESLSKTTRL
jgi:hypothetical protein